ncbi:1-acyl-sn-glycerol-3-phosphate acyltransferase [Sulfuriferula plumbiphila]|uniref:1-acyl-sn-glycerol-3-phosphate acyltransferase n=1 Tax=Sulfuriferula plumbiphila TaxID=171865 RepID=A0A512L502_9PROT|nr:lysophospholipid acyltransferase family protein [Sulfuriferula plumbiphila]BBP03270.1 1-acyl-sn-glycerol-3-phosphate acyltransferase [Sulfuriferula plumbiphila]GEP29557.1 1-acyl-sn-glycerol-3-phosphate acyltransferase [Sulfuriferula plumbiphila]
MIVLLLRSALFAVLQTLLTIVFSLVALLTFPFSARIRYRTITLWNRIVVWLAEVVCGIRYRVIGLENLPNTPAVVMAKHQSAWETIALPVLLPPMALVIKRELLWVPFFGWGMAMLSPIAINRAEGRAALKQIVEQGRVRLAEGFGVMIFPEGTRMAPGEIGRYGIGGAWLASHVNALVVPVAHNAGELWPKNSFLKHPGLITLSIGPVIDAAGMKPDALNEQVKAWIETEMKQLQRHA